MQKQQVIQQQHTGLVAGDRLELALLVAHHDAHAVAVGIGAEDEVMVEIGKRRSQKDEMVEVSFDGNNAVKLEVGDRFIVHRATDTAKICKLRKESFLEILRKKMQAYT